MSGYTYGGPNGATHGTEDDGGTYGSAPPSTGLPRTRAGSSGWHVEVDHPDGQVLRPAVLDDLQRKPTVNDQTELEIPVERNERWLADALEEADLRAWKDGQRLPVDTLEDVETNPDRVVLHASGGAELDRRVQKDVEVEAADNVMRDLVQTETGYTANVDAPATTQSTETMQDPSTQSEWTGATETSGLSGIPATVTNDTLTAQDACDPRDALDHNDGETVAFITDDKYNDGEAAYFSTDGDYVKFDITVPYTIPGDQVGIKLRDETAGDNDATITHYWDGTKISEASPTGLVFGWDEFGDDAYSSNPGGYQEEIGADLEPGQTYTLRIEVSGSAPTYVVDVGAVVYDQRYSFTFPNPDATENAGGYLSGPEPKPDAVAVQLDAEPTILSVVKGDLTADFDDTSNGQQVGIRNLGGNAFTTAANTQTVSADFADPGDLIQAELTLSRYGTQNAFPTDGINGQTVSSMTLDATLEDIPLVIDEKLEGDLVDVLAQVAGDADYLFEVAWDSSAATMAIEATQPGQRTSSRDTSLADYSTQKIPSNIQFVKVLGAAAETEETFTANVGTAVDLAEDDLVPGSERVTDASGTVYARGDDYELDRLAGTITATSGGGLTDGSDYTINYAFERSGTFETDNYSGALEEELVARVKSATSDRACGLAAKLILDDVSSARLEADVTLPSTVPVDWSLIEAIDLEGVPTDGEALAIYEWQETPQGLQLRLGSRNRREETIQQIRSTLGATSRRV